MITLASPDFGIKPVADKPQAMWYRLAHGVMAFLLILLMAFDLPNFISIRGGPPPKITYTLLVVLVLPLVLARSRQITQFFISDIGIWFAVYLGIIAIHLVYILGTSSNDHADLVFVRFMLLFLSTVYALFLANAENRFVDLALKFAAWLIPLMIIIDFFKPGLMYPIATPGSVLARGAAVYINPNRAGEATLLFLLLTLPLLSRHWRVALFILSGIGVFFTFSRAAILGWFLLGFACWKVKLLPRYFALVPVIGFFVIIAVGSVLEFFLRTYLGIDGGIANIIDRLSFFQGGGASDFSANERSEMLMAGLQLFADYPFFGAGADATSVWHYPAGPHNQFVVMAAEFGILGLILWLGVILMTMKSQYLRLHSLHFIAAGFLAYFSLFSHNMADSIYWLLGITLFNRKWYHN